MSEVSGVKALKDIREFLEILEETLENGIQQIYPFVINPEELCLVIHDMEEMIGSDELKLHVAEMLQLLLVSEGKTDGHTLHTVVTGVPGTGKTTWAKLLARAWAAMGVLQPKKSATSAAKKHTKHTVHRIAFAGTEEESDDDHSGGGSSKKNKSSSLISSRTRSKLRNNNNNHNENHQNNRDDDAEETTSANTNANPVAKNSCNSKDENNYTECDCKSNGDKKNENETGNDQRISKEKDQTSTDMVIIPISPPEEKQTTQPTTANENDIIYSNDELYNLPFFTHDPIIAILNEMQNNLSLAATNMDKTKLTLDTCRDIYFEDKQFCNMIEQGVDKHDAAREYITQTMRANYQVRKELSLRALLEFSQMLTTYSEVAGFNNNNEIFQNNDDYDEDDDYDYEITEGRSKRLGEEDESDDGDNSIDELRNASTAMGSLFHHILMRVQNNPLDATGDDDYEDIDIEIDDNHKYFVDDDDEEKEIDLKEEKVGEECNMDVDNKHHPEKINTNNEKESSLLTPLALEKTNKKEKEDELQLKVDVAPKVVDTKKGVVKNNPIKESNTNTNTSDDKGTDKKQQVLSTTKSNQSSNKKTKAGKAGGRERELKEKPKFIFRVVSRVDLVAGYQGHTAKQTTAVLESMRGGVLVIDEAYALKQDEKDWFGQEAIDTINLYMSEHADEIVIIFAGYKEQTEAMLRTNPGIARRIGWRFNIDKYEPKDLTDIFLKQCDDNGWVCNVDSPKISSLITDNKDYFENQGGDTFRLLFQSKLVYAKHNWKQNYQSKVSNPEEHQSKSENPQSKPEIPSSDGSDKKLKLPDKENALIASRIIDIYILKEAMEKHVHLIKKENGEAEAVYRKGEEPWRNMYS